jgi:hypothetical protein
MSSSFPASGTHFSKEVLHMKPAALPEDLFCAIRDCDNRLVINWLMLDWSTSGGSCPISNGVWE